MSPENAIRERTAGRDDPTVVLEADVEFVPVVESVISGTII